MMAAYIGCRTQDDYSRGKQFYDRGDFAQAAQYLQRAAQSNPADVKPLRKLASIYIREEKYADAATVLEKARELAPDDGDLAARYALVLDRIGKPGEALVAAHEALNSEDVRKDTKMRERLEGLVARLEGKPGPGREAGGAPGPAHSDATSTGSVTRMDSATTVSTAPELPACAPLPAPPITRQDLVRLVPDDAPGHVIIRWRTETQEENLGFNIYRSENPDGPYERVNRSIIPGEGSTNIPREYCFEDKPLPRGKVYYYYIESVSLSGTREVLEGTKGTRVKVKTVEEEREWLWRKVMGEDSVTTPAAAQKPAAAVRRLTTATRTSVPQPIAVAHFTLSTDSSSTASAQSEPIY
jgi:hypothetical protein